MAEDDGLTFAPVLVEDLDAVLGGDGRHAWDSFRESRSNAAGRTLSRFMGIVNAAQPDALDVSVPTRRILAIVGDKWAESMTRHRLAHDLIGPRRSQRRVICQ